MRHSSLSLSIVFALVLLIPGSATLQGSLMTRSQFVSEINTAAGSSMSVRRGNDPVTFVEAAKLSVEAFDISHSQNNARWYVPYVRVLANRNAIPFDILYFDSELTLTQGREIIRRLAENDRSQLSLTFELLDEMERYAGDGVDSQNPSILETSPRQSDEDLVDSFLEAIGEFTNFIDLDLPEFTPRDLFDRPREPQVPTQFINEVQEEQIQYERQFSGIDFHREQDEPIFPSIRYHRQFVGRNIRNPVVPELEKDYYVAPKPLDIRGLIGFDRVLRDRRITPVQRQPHTRDHLSTRSIRNGSVTGVNRFGQGLVGVDTRLETERGLTTIQPLDATTLYTVLPDGRVRFDFTGVNLGAPVQNFELYDAMVDESDEEISIEGYTDDLILPNVDVGLKAHVKAYFPADSADWSIVIGVEPGTYFRARNMRLEGDRDVITISAQGVIIRGALHGDRVVLPFEGTVTHIGVDFVVSKYVVLPLRRSGEIVNWITDGVKCGYQKLPNGPLCGYDIFRDQSCGRETVTSSELCGWTEIRDPEKCGWLEIEDEELCGVETRRSEEYCGYDLIPGCDEDIKDCRDPKICQVPRKCKVAGVCRVADTCEVDSTCRDESQPKICEDRSKPRTCRRSNEGEHIGEIRGTISFRLTNAGLVGDFNGQYCNPDDHCEPFRTDFIRANTRPPHACFRSEGIQLLESMLRGSDAVCIDY